MRIPVKSFQGLDTDKLPSAIILISDQLASGLFKPLVLIPWAFFVGLSRVYLGVHYPSDVLAPIVFSIPIAWFVSHLYHRIIKHPKSLTFHPG